LMTAGQYAGSRASQPKCHGYTNDTIRTF
jgi:hypothetical protein